MQINQSLHTHCLETLLKLFSIKESLCGEEVVVGLHSPPWVAQETHIQHSGVVFTEKLLKCVAQLLTTTVSRLPLCPGLPLLLTTVNHMTLNLDKIYDYA